MNRLKLCVTSALFAALSACGGGGGDSNAVGSDSAANGTSAAGTGESASGTDAPAGPAPGGEASNGDSTAGDTAGGNPPVSGGSGATNTIVWPADQRLTDYLNGPFEVVDTASKSIMRKPGYQPRFAVTAESLETDPERLTFTGTGYAFEISGLAGPELLPARVLRKVSYELGEVIDVSGSPIGQFISSQSGAVFPAGSFVVRANRVDTFEQAGARTTTLVPTSLFNDVARNVLSPK
ncbi:MAG: hypothetical protein R3E87_17150 [Burkholderiaceae bacterium]